MLIVLIHNDGTGTNESANYTYEVRVNDKVLERGNIKEHNRSDGWRVLLGSIGECQACQLTPLATDRAKRAAKSKPSASKRSKSGAAGKA